MVKSNDSASLTILEDDPLASDVQELLRAHLAYARASTPSEFSFALDAEGLNDRSVLFFSARREGELLGIGALKDHDRDLAEIKSMHTRADVRGQGVGKAMIGHLIDAARRKGYKEIRLETGTGDDFAAARGLYKGAGFQASSAFGDYRASAHNCFWVMHLDDD